MLVFGGAFDPPHQGHKALLVRAQKEIKPDLTLVVPTSDIAVHKRKTFLPAKARLVFLADFLKPFKKTKILAYEINQKKPVYTWETIKHISQKYPSAHIHFLVGSDNISLMKTWVNMETLLKHPRLFFIVGKRKGFTQTSWPQGLPREKFQILEGAFPQIASTEIRKKENLPNLIKSYLKLTLPLSRFKHTLACLRLAQELARRHRQNSWKTRVAALLHDISRTRENFINSREAIAHGQKSARLAWQIFGINDPEILEAIGNHTVGKPGMGPIAQILYVADLASYDRKFPEALKVRRLARGHIKEALRKAVLTKINYLNRTRQPINPKTFKFLKSLG